ncbi:hypothetical protein LCGC14_1126760, partial [marine sediment metagenome]
GRLALPAARVPILGPTLQGVARGVTAVELAPGKVLELPFRGAARLAKKAFGREAFSVGGRATDKFTIDHLPSNKELSDAMFKTDTFKRIAQHIPGMRKIAPATTIEEMRATLTAVREVEDAVTQGVLIRTRILDMGQDTKGQSLAYLRELGTTQRIYGVNSGAIASARQVTPRFPGESLALGDIIQAPERYIFRHKNGLEYAKRAQKVTEEIYQLAIQEGIDVKRVGLEPFQEFIHWVVTGRANREGVVEMTRRGSRAVGGVVASMKHRRNETMIEGIKNGYRYANDVETYVATYVDDMFKAIGDKRLGTHLDEVVLRTEGHLPTNPLERLHALYPEQELAWTGVQKQMADLGYALSSVRRAARGEVLPSATVRALERRAPEVAEKLAAAGTDKRKLRALSKSLKTEVDNLRPEWWKAKAIRADKMEIARRPILGEGEGQIRTKAGGTHPMFQNQIYPASIADQASKLLNQEAAQFLKVTAKISATGRLAIAVLDDSVIFIQGLVGLGSHPAISAQAALRSVQALLDPQAFQRYLVKHAATINERTYQGGSQRAVEFWESLGWLTKVAGKIPGGKLIVGQTYGRAQAGWSMYSTVFKDMMWQNNGKNWMRKGQGPEYARLLDRMMGQMSFAQLGVPVNVQSFLTGWVSFAPQYRMATLSYFAQAFKGGMTGAQVRGDLARFVTAATVAYVGFTEATGRKAFLNPFTDGKKFMSIEIDGRWVGPGGAVVSMIRAFADITASALSIGENEPMDFLTMDKWKNPLMRAWFMQSATLPRQISEIATRQDFMGYPLETTEDWALWAAEQVTPIFAQDIFFDRTGVPQSPISVLGNFFGLRTSPETRWEALNKKILSLKAHETVTDYTEEQRERIAGGDSVLSVLDKYQKAEMFSSFADTNPELIEMWGKADYDALVRASVPRKNYETAVTGVRTTAMEGMIAAIDVGIQVDGEDTEWLRNKYNSLMNDYGIGNGIVRDNPEFQDMFDEWNELQEKNIPDAEVFDLAYWDYVETVISPDRTLPNGDFDFDAYKEGLQLWREEWGEDVYQKILKVQEQGKRDVMGAGELAFPEWTIRLWKDRLALNDAGYWELPRQPLKDMTQEDLDEERVPEQYIGMVQAYLAAENDEAREALVEANPLLSKDWRQELRLGSAEEDARLALWGYGGRLQSKEAYNQVVKWAEEMGIPFDQIGIDLPPRQHLDQYFAHNKVVAETSGSSIESRLYLLENPDYLQYLVENNIRTDDLSDESIDALRLRVTFKPDIEAYDSLSNTDSETFIENADAREKKRREILAGNTEFRDARKRIEAYGFGASGTQVEAHVAYSILGDEDAPTANMKLFLLNDKTGYYDLRLAVPKGKSGHLEPLSVTLTRPQEIQEKIWLIDKEFATQDAEWIAIGDKYSKVENATYIAPTEVIVDPLTGKERNKQAAVIADARGKLFAGDEDYRTAVWTRDAYEKGVPERHVGNYVEVSQLAGLGKDRFLRDHNTGPNDYYQTVYHGKDSLQKNTAVDFSMVPDAQYDVIVDRWAEQIDKLLEVSDWLTIKAIVDDTKRQDAIDAARDKIYDAQGNAGLRQDVLRRDAYLKFRGDDIKNATRENVEKYVAYYSLPIKGADQELYLKEHFGFSVVLGIDEPEKHVESYRISVDWELWDRDYEALGDIDSDDYVADSKERAKARDLFLDANPDYAYDSLRRSAFDLEFPDEFIVNFADYYTIIRTKPDNWTTLWKDNRYMADNRSFYKTAKSILGWTTSIDFDEIPAVWFEEDFNNIFEQMTVWDKDSRKFVKDRKARSAYRGKNKAFDDEGVRIGLWEPTKGGRGRGGTSTRAALRGLAR